MTRHLFIISAPLHISPQTLDFYMGVTTDVGNYLRFYQSPTGGAFDYDSEITVFDENASWTDIQLGLFLNQADYVIVVFTGHGFIASRSGETILNINPTEKKSISTVLDCISASRRLILVDLCRIYRNDDESNFIGDPESIEQLEFPSFLAYETARKMFNAALQNTPEGTQIIFSCSEGESSRIDSNGSYFTRALLKPVSVWGSLFDKKSVLLTLGAYRFSKQTIQIEFNSVQTPMMKSSSNRPNFPFAIRYGTEMEESVIDPFDWRNRIL